jgi:hypothetical protein
MSETYHGFAIRQAIGERKINILQKKSIYPASSSPKGGAEISLGRDINILMKAGHPMVA